MNTNDFYKMFVKFMGFSDTSPDIVVEDGDNTYVMYALPGTTSINSNTYKIIRYRKSDNWTFKEYAEGTDAYDKIAANYANYNYKFKE
ncbi:MAG: hypothetical protein HPY57_12865 [Ignavibacteria bacterium]|nr:hypothetical protein [Ignavibacteria bacterium]